jgi:hypothetical protein
MRQTLKTYRKGGALYDALIFRDAENALTSRIGSHWNVSGTRIFQTFGQFSLTKI